MSVRILFFALALATTSAIAEDITYNGRTFEVAADQDAKPIVRMQSSRYSVRLAPEQIIQRAQACLSGQSGAAVDSADPTKGMLAGHLSNSYRAMFSTHTINSRLLLEAGDGWFQITQSDITLGQEAGTASGEAPLPLSQTTAGWEKAADALIQGENKLVDCLYR